LFALPFVVVNATVTSTINSNKIWLSDIGIEDPKSDIILLEFRDTALCFGYPRLFCDAEVEFEYNLGKYAGLYQIYPISTRLLWHDDAYCSAVITHIRSL